MWDLLYRQKAFNQTAFTDFQRTAVHSQEHVCKRKIRHLAGGKERGADN